MSEKVLSEEEIAEIAYELGQDIRSDEGFDRLRDSHEELRSMLAAEQALGEEMIRSAKIHENRIAELESGLRKFVDVANKTRDTMSLTCSVLQAEAEHKLENEPYLEGYEHALRDFRNGVGFYLRNPPCELPKE